MHRSTSDGEGSAPVAFRGKWRIRWFDNEGKRQSVVFDTYAEAERELRRQQVEADEVKAGTRRPSPVDHTFGELADYWEKHRRPRSAAKRTTSACSESTCGRRSVRCA
jgi:hypothetical protein